jgi:predicted metal-dependent phosphoesterase TrpH/glycosyltransferase involved in cell wall biosynthesis
MADVPPKLRIAQVTPYAIEDERETNRYVVGLSRALQARGHRVVIVAPSHSRKLVKQSRTRIRRAVKENSLEGLFDDEGSDAPQVLAIGDALPFPPAKLGGTAAIPVDVSRTLEQLFQIDGFDFVHVHEPYAPSAASAALRTSFTLNVGTFHEAAERTLSTQVGRRFVELFFGRLDARTATSAVTRDLVGSYFGGDYSVIGPGTDAPHDRPPRREGAPIEIVLDGVEERAAQRILIRALRKLPRGLEWHATFRVSTDTPVVPPGLSNRMRERTSFVAAAALPAADLLATADIAVAASAGTAASPGYVARIVASGAAPLASDIEAYKEALDDGELGLMFEAGNAAALADQLARLLTDPALLTRTRSAARRFAEENSWDAVAERFERIYHETRARRHDLIPAKAPKPHIQQRLRRRKRIDVDLHMHTDHSHDCATPVEVLLETARIQGLGAIAVTDHNLVSGAHEAAAKAAEYGVKVIVGEEVKTKDQGEVIGLFIEQKIPKGVTLQEAIAEIKRQGGLVYVPHPFDRMHSVPDYKNLLEVLEDIDLIEVFNPRVAFSAFNDEAARFAAKYRIVAGAGSDSHVAQGLGSVRINMYDFDGPEEFLESLREADIARSPSSLVYVQAMKFLQTNVGVQSKVPPPRSGAKARRTQIVKQGTVDAKKRASRR